MKEGSSRGHALIVDPPSSFETFSEDLLASPRRSGKLVGMNSVALRTHSLVLALAILFVFELAHAKRVVRITPLDTPGGWSEAGKVPAGSAKANDGPCWAGLARKVDLINLSGVEQNVTVTMKNVNFGWGYCNPVTPLSGNWKGSPGASTCFTATNTGPGGTLNVKLPPNGTGQAIFSVLCRLSSAGTTQCVLNNNNVSGSSELQALTNTSAEATLELEVAEDRGAIVGTVVAYAVPLCIDYKNITRENVQINGGRPF